MNGRLVVDVFIPLRRFAEFWRWYEKDFDYWPLWIVPYRVDDPYPWIAPDHARSPSARSRRGLS